MAYDVFISYAHADKLAAEAACAAFEQQAIRCWIAPRDIAPGAEWGEAIIDAIVQCPVMVLIFSAHANESRQVRRELERAVSAGNTIMPVRLEAIEPTRSLAYFVAGVHWLDALTPPLEIHFQRLTQTIKTVLAGREPAGAAITVAPVLPPSAETEAPGPTAKMPVKPLRIEDAKALMERATPLLALGRLKDAIPFLTELIDRFSGTADPDLLQLVGDAAFQRGEALAHLNQPEAALAAFRNYAEANRQSSSPAIRLTVLKCLTFEGSLLNSMGRSAEAVAQIETTIDWVASFPDDRLLPNLATIMGNRVIISRSSGRYDEAIAFADVLIDRFAASTNTSVKVEVGRALFHKGAVLLALKRQEDAATAFQLALDELGKVRSATVTELTLSTLHERGNLRFGAKAYDRALGDYQQVLTLIGDAPLTAVLKLKRANALFNAALSLKMLERQTEALVLFDRLLTDFRDSDDPAIIKLAANAMTQAKALRES